MNPGGTSIKSIVITGSSSGIGKATAKYFAKRGWRVAATLRAPEREDELNQIDNVTIYKLDVTDEANIEEAARQIIGDLGTVDVVLNNAGYGLMGPFEAASPEQVRRQFETNVFGLMNVTRAFLPHFRANRAGLFLNVSSINGLTTLPFGSLYIGTKFAVEGFSETLAYELSELGIQVKLIEPGGVDTDFGGRSLIFATREGLTDYDEALGRFQANFENAGLSSSPTEDIARVIYEAATDGTDRLRYLVGADAEALYHLRQARGDEGFIVLMRRRVLAE